MKYRILCLLLLILIFLLALKNYETWTRPAEMITEKRPLKRPETKPEPTQTTGTSQKPPSLEPVVLISEKNIFNPDRKDFPVVTGAVAGMELTRKSTPRPQVVLYGVTISEDFQSATIANPGKPLKKREREILTLKLGERIGEYKLAKISPDRIMLESAEDNFEVLLYDPAMPKRRVEVKTEVKPATVTSTLPTAPPPPAQVLPLRPAPVEPPKPTPPREPSPERVVPPPAPPTQFTPPVTPSVPAPSFQRGRTPFYPPSGPQVPESQTPGAVE